MKKTALIIIATIIFPSLVWAKREHPEKWYQVKWCQAHKGQVEVVLPDGRNDNRKLTPVDNLILTLLSLS